MTSCAAPESSKTVLNAHTVNRDTVLTKAPELSCGGVFASSFIQKQRKDTSKRDQQLQQRQQIASLLYLQVPLAAALSLAEDLAAVVEKASPAFLD